MPGPGRQAADGGQRISGREARGGEVILRRPWMRILFIAGLVGFAVLAIFVRF